MAKSKKSKAHAQEKAAKRAAKRRATRQANREDLAWSDATPFWHLRDRHGQVVFEVFDVEVPIPGLGMKARCFLPLFDTEAKAGGYARTTDPSRVPATTTLKEFRDLTLSGGAEKVILNPVDATGKGGTTADIRENLTDVGLPHNPVAVGTSTPAGNGLWVITTNGRVMFRVGRDQGERAVLAFTSTEMAERYLVRSGIVDEGKPRFLPLPEFMDNTKRMAASGLIHGFWCDLLYDGGPGNYYSLSGDPEDLFPADHKFGGFVEGWASDREWFASNQTEWYRLRGVEEGELERLPFPPGHSHGQIVAVLVVQIEPGMRMRCPLTRTPTTAEAQATAYEVLRKNGRAEPVLPQ